MPLSSGTSWIPFLLLTVAKSIEAFDSRQSDCTFPQHWEGTWFQSGVRTPISISRDLLSSKGRCLKNEGDKFLLVDDKSCYRCVVIHEKHSNVLQYKETYCHSRNSLSSLCSYITGDALLYSMFREEASPVPCPFHGPMTFSYNRGHGTCSVPQSNVDTCTDDSRLLFRYQACPDVPASESAVEELECLATWKEGSSRYLVGRLHHGHASSNEDRYRCFVYERAGQTVGNPNRAVIDQEVALQAGGPIPEGSPEIYRVAQSGDATCNGLFSPMEGSRTMTLSKVSSPGKCRFPSWLTGGETGNGLTWHTLDLTMSYTFHPRNASLHVSRTNASTFARNEAETSDEQDAKILCNSIEASKSGQTVTILVAHFTVGCQSGYMCMGFYRRDGHVIEVQTGSVVSRAEEACSSPHYQPRSIPYLTLVTRSPEPRQCPYVGKFTVTGLSRNLRHTRESHKRNERVRHGQEDRGVHSRKRQRENRVGRRSTAVHRKPEVPQDQEVLVIEETENEREDGEKDAEYNNFDTQKRKKREGAGDNTSSGCSSTDVTTLIVGCSTADRMELQSGCVDNEDGEEEVVSAYSCHGRWFDPELSTQFVIATPLSRGTWERIQTPISRRLCFMYKESGGIVSLTASPVACQRGVPPPTPMLAFNATSTGQCVEDSGGTIPKSSWYLTSLITTILLTFR